jgi:osmotically-inducible protein OsmY
MRAILLGSAFGALLAYFFDPKKGSERRGMVMGKAGSAANLGSTVQHSVHNVATGAQSAVRGSVPHAPDNPDPDDNTLKDRIESEVFRNPKYSREHLNILVVDGVVDLHGQLPTQDEIDSLIARIEGMRNVKGVQSYLHLPGTPAPNKEESLEVSS